MHWVCLKDFCKALDANVRASLSTTNATAAAAAAALRGTLGSL